MSIRTLRMTNPALLGLFEPQSHVAVNGGAEPSIRSRKRDKICWFFCSPKKKSKNVKSNAAPHEALMEMRLAAVSAAGTAPIFPKVDIKHPISVSHGHVLPSGTASGESASQQLIRSPSDVSQINHNPSSDDHVTPASNTMQHESVSQAEARQPFVVSPMINISFRHSQSASPFSTTQDKSESQQSERPPSGLSQVNNDISEDGESLSHFPEQNWSTSRSSTEPFAIVNQGEIELRKNSTSIFPSSVEQERFTSSPPISSSSIDTQFGNEIPYKTQYDVFPSVEQDVPSSKSSETSPFILTQIENEPAENISPVVSTNAGHSRSTFLRSARPFPTDTRVEEELSEDSTSALPSSSTQHKSSPPPSLSSSSIVTRVDGKFPSIVSSIPSFSSEQGESASLPPTSSSSADTQVGDEPAVSSNSILPSSAQQSTKPSYINTQLVRQFSSNNKCILTPTTAQDESPFEFSDNSKSIISPGTVQSYSEALYIRQPSHIISQGSKDPSPSDSSTPLETPRASRTVQDTDAMYQSLNSSSQGLNCGGRLTPIRTVQDTHAMDQITRPSSTVSNNGRSPSVNNQPVASSVSQPICSRKSQHALSADTHSDVSADTQSGSSGDGQSASSDDSQFSPSSDNQSVSSYDSQSVYSCDTHYVPSDTEEDKAHPPPLAMADPLPALPEEQIQGHMEHDFTSEQLTSTTDEQEPNLQSMGIPGTDLFDSQVDSADSQGDYLRLNNAARSSLRPPNPDDAQVKSVQVGELPPLKDESPVRVCAYSSDRQFLAVGMESGNIVIYETGFWKIVSQLKGHRLSVLSLDFSPNGDKLVCGDWNSTVRLLDVANEETLLIMEGHCNRVQSVVFSPCGAQIASASHDKTMRLWSSETGECHFVLGDHPSYVTKVAYMSNGRRLVSCSDDGTICVWDPETGRVVDTWNTPRLYVRCIAMSADGQQGALAFGYKQSRIQLLSMVTGELGPVLESTGDITCIAFSPNGQWIASSGKDNTIIMWDISSGQLVSSFSAHVNKITACTFSPDSLQIASGDSSGSLRLWDVNTNDNISTFDSQPLVGGALFVAFASDGRHILSCRRRQCLEQWDFLTGALIPLPYEMMVGVCTFSISPNGSQLATGCLDGSIELWGGHTYTAERTLLGHTEAIVKLAYSPCDRWLVSCDMSGTVRLWDLHNLYDRGKIVETGPGYSIFKDVVFSPTRQEFSVISDMLVRQYDPQKQNLSAHVHKIHLDNPMYPFDYSKDGQRLVFSSCLQSHSVHVSGPESERRDFELKGHDQEVLCAAFSPCDSRILTGSRDKTVRLWSSKVDSWTCISIEREFSEAVTCIAWNPVVLTDFVTGCRDGSVQVWRISSAEARDDVSIALVWGSSVGRLSAPALTCKEVVDLDPLYGELVVQPSAIDDSSAIIKQSDYSSIQRDICAVSIPFVSFIIFSGSYHTVFSSLLLVLLLAERKGV